MIADGERPTGEGVELLPEGAVAYRQQVRLPQHPVRLDRPRHWTVAVLAHHPHPRPDHLRRFQERAARVVQFADEPRQVTALRAETLRVVVEVRQVNERQVWFLLQ